MFLELPLYNKLDSDKDSDYVKPASKPESEDIEKGDDHQDEVNQNGNGAV